MSEFSKKSNPCAVKSVNHNQYIPIFLFSFDFKLTFPFSSHPFTLSFASSLFFVLLQHDGIWSPQIGGEEKKNETLEFTILGSFVNIYRAKINTDP